MEYSNLFVVLMGLCTVFIGLICIIILVSVMSGIIRKTKKSSEIIDSSASAAVQRSAAPPARGEVTPELVAAISAAIAEDLGTDVSAIRILSLKKA